ncbi:DUF1501 domain-containing protein [Mucilaginibacter sp. X5P1]|uniref:DUF1501 domain-containing protein n=1 Tax=Mucilaginibacter sp. X5P1 TaxID=2723088 RepID=UPI0017B1F899|nr:hypothetical protein [Mucilaginibacter sp. X5P1]MBB6137600.1 uncharacterized protein (DUF1501 family) [Mucilaginibacter sp. X5P1]
MVCIFQRGAMDGLMAVTPFTDQNLQAARLTLFMSAAKGNGTSLIDLDGRFGLHPYVQAFEPMFREKRLGIVHGIGSLNNTRSHFDVQDYTELATPFNKGTASGWLNRAVGLLGHDAITPFSAVSMTSAMLLVSRSNSSIDLLSGSNSAQSVHKMPSLEKLMAFFMITSLTML